MVFEFFLDFPRYLTISKSIKGTVRITRTYGETPDKYDIYIYIGDFSKERATQNKILLTNAIPILKTKKKIIDSIVLKTKIDLLKIFPGLKRQIRWGDKLKILIQLYQRGKLIEEYLSEDYEILFDDIKKMINIKGIGYSSDTIIPGNDFVIWIYVFNKTYFKRNLFIEIICESDLIKESNKNDEDIEHDEDLGKDQDSEKTGSVGSTEFTVEIPPYYHETPGGFKYPLSVPVPKLNKASAKKLNFKVRIFGERMYKITENQSQSEANYNNEENLRKMNPRIGKEKIKLFEKKFSIPLNIELEGFYFERIGFVREVEFEELANFLVDIKNRTPYKVKGNVRLSFYALETDFIFAYKRKAYIDPNNYEKVSEDFSIPLLCAGRRYWGYALGSFKAKSNSFRIEGLSQPQKSNIPSKRPINITLRMLLIDGVFCGDLVPVEVNLRIDLSEIPKGLTCEIIEEQDGLKSRIIHILKVKSDIAYSTFKWKAPGTPCKVRIYPNLKIKNRSIDQSLLNWEDLNFIIEKRIKKKIRPEPPSEEKAQPENINNEE